MKFKSFDEKEIYIYEWTDVKEPIGVVQIIHGMTEHAKRYQDFAKFLNKHGFIVVADDHRGHGLTDSASLGYSKGNMFEDTVRDEGEITKYYQKKYPNIPYFVFGFSYGSFINQSYISKYGSLINGAVIGGSNKKKDFEVYLGSLVTNIANLFGGEKKEAKLIEKLSFGAYAKNFSDGEWLSHDAENNKNYHEDKFCGFTCTNRFYADFFSGLKKLYTKKYKESLRRDLPLLLISGSNDPVGDMGRGMQKLYDYYTKEVRMSSVKLTLLEGYRHEFIGIKDGQEKCFNELLAFFNENL